MNAIHRHVVLAVLATVLAGIAWAGAWYAFRMIVAGQTEHRDMLIMAQKAERESAVAAQLRTAVAQSEQERSQLEMLSRADVVSVASAIEAAGKSVGATARVVDVDAIPDKDPQLAEITGVHAIGYAVDARGSFQQLMSLLQLLEVLPAPSTIEQFTLSKDTEAGARAGAWRLVLRLRLLTTEKAT